VNDVGPCETQVTKSGKTLFDTIVPEYVQTFGELNGVVYKGQSLSAWEIIIALLSSGEFTADMKKSDFNDVASACACSPSDELICALVFGKDLWTRQG